MEKVSRQPGQSGRDTVRGAPSKSSMAASP